MSEPLLRVGVIGLGVHWANRLRPALEMAPLDLRPSALYDDVPRRAAREAEALGCRALASLRGLVTDPEVDLIAVVDDTWVGLQALAWIVEAGKPLVTGIPLTIERERLKRLARRAEQTGSRITQTVWPWLDDLRTAIAQAIPDPLGEIRTVSGSIEVSSFDRRRECGPLRQASPVDPLLDPGVLLIEWACLLFERAPETVHAYRAGDAIGSSVTVELTYSGARFFRGRIGLRQESEAGSSVDYAPGRLHLEIHCLHGRLSLDVPGTIGWQHDSKPGQIVALPGPTSIEDAQAVPSRWLTWASASHRGSEPDGSGWTRTLRVARILEAIRRSLASGGTIPVTDED